MKTYPSASSIYVNRVNGRKSTQLTKRLRRILRLTHPVRTQAILSRNFSDSKRHSAQRSVRSVGFCTIGHRTGLRVRRKELAQQCSS